MKLVKQLLIGAAIFAAVSNAQAATYNLGTLSSDYTEFGSYSVAKGSFSDTINFSLAGTSDTDFGVGSIFVKVGKITRLDITGLTLSLFKGTTDLGLSGTDFSATALGAGDYHLLVTGNATGTLGGSYAGGINVSPVPEADTYAMMLAGLGLMGFVARRRRSL
ncbi:FxDxF family PEP-CTERM protein [Methylotenera mobilis]|uniref:Ice-binding protein C-terminal domain-containing protein n=1 Tax=Methylotenera mobilis (strain JLW8 / ATCC BAA-1282 / DSM 17540) TaxID=583345 RepID=C6WXN6_METML|nr:FxDxF family PEP-CTERM protein [Methylotenera mobilis]ACT48685.1 protein of unknown function DUF1555 [Methylotenera mobilis JLW8]